MALLVGLVSLAHAQETTTDTSSDPGQADDPPVALQQNSYATLVSNLGQPDGVRADIITDVQQAQSFIAGPNPAGYRFQGIRVAASASEQGGNVLVPEVRVSLHKNDRGLPGSRLHTLTVPDDFASTGEFMEYTLSAPPGTVIPGGATYWVVFETLSETLYLGATSSPREDQVPPPVDGWTITEYRYTRLSGFAWQRLTRVIELAVLGSPQNTIEKLGGNESFDSDERAGVGSSEVGGFASGSYWGSATSFTPGGDAGWYALSSINFGVSTNVGGLFRVAIHGDDSDGPAAGALYVAYVGVPAGPIRILDLTAAFPDNATLEPGRKYWAVFDEVTGAGFYSVHVAANGNEDAGFESWAIGDTGYRIEYLTATGFSWSTSSSRKPIQMTFHGYAQPERVLVGAHGLRDTAADGPFLRFGAERVTKVWLNLPKGRTYDGGATNPSIRLDCEPQFVEGPDTETSWRLCSLSTNRHYDHEWAGGRGFTTGPHPTGYTISGLGVDIDLESGTLDPVANLYAVDAFSSREGARDPQSPLASYQATAGIGRSPDRFSARTAVSEDLHVEPGRTYVAYFQNAANGYYQTPNASRGENQGATGWTLGGPYGSRFVHPVGFGADDWNLDNEFKWIPLNVYGWPNPLPPAPNPDPPAPAPALVSNLGKTSRASVYSIVRTVALDRTVALSFTTGEHDAGYALHGVQVEVHSEPAEFVGGLRAAIHVDEDGSPGASLHEMGMQTNPRRGVVTFHAPASATLSPTTTYWLVVDAAETATDDHQLKLALTASAGGEDDCAARDWSLGIVSLGRAVKNRAWSVNSSRLKMAILGERASGASAEFGEPTCGDLPGATTTGRLVVDGDGVKGRHASARDADWYAVELEAGVDYQFDADPTDPQPRLYLLKIHDDQGTELRTSAIAPVGGPPNWYQHPNRVNSLPFRTDQAGAYYVSIASPKGGHAPDRVYTLSAQSDDHPADTSTTAEVEVGGSLQTYLMRTKTNYNSSATDDVDWIRVALRANVHYRFVYDVACLHEGIIEGIYDSDGALVPDSGSSIARKTDGTCTDLTMAFTAPGDGDYYVAVTARGSYYPENKRHPFGGVYGTLKVDGTITTSMGQRANSPATGGPGITGTVQAGETLTATTDGIEDEDGLTGAVFAYQWVRSDTDIEGAASSTYTMTGDDEGKAIQVRVTFTDDAGNAESLTSYAVLSVPPLTIPDSETPPKSTATREAREAQGEQEAAETPLTAATHDAPESHDGQEDFTFELRFSEELGTGFSYKTLRDHAFTVTRGTVVGARRLDGDSDTPNIRWEISVTPDSNADVTVELPVTTDCDAQGAICAEDGRVLSSPLKFTVKGPPLTASFESVPTSHNGSDSFRIRIAFSEAPKSGFSYTTMRDHAFTVTGGSVTGARRLVSGKNLRWEIVVSPDSNGDVTITLPATTDCDAQGAICADGDKKLSNRLERTVSGPGE